MMISKWKAYNKESLCYWKWQADAHLPLNIIQAATGAVRDFGTYFYLGILVITGRISIGIFSQMLTAASTLNSSLNSLINAVQEIVKRTNYAYEYVKFMRYPAAIEKGTRTLKTSRIPLSSVMFRSLTRTRTLRYWTG